MSIWIKRICLSFMVLGVGILWADETWLNLEIRPALPWFADPGNDFPAGGWIWVYGAQTQQTITVTNEFNAPAGTYQAFLQARAYDQAGTPLAVVKSNSPTFHVVAGGAASTRVGFDDRDWNSLYSDGSMLVATSAFTNVVWVFEKDASINTNLKISVASFVLTANSEAVIDADGVLINLNTQSVSQANHLPPEAGNLLFNSSFENGREGWNLATGNRTNTQEYYVDTAASNAFHGSKSLKFKAAQAPYKTLLYHDLGRVKTNMTYTYSVWARDRQGTNANIISININRQFIQPTNFPAAPTYTAFTFLNTTNWQRLSLTATNLTRYPLPYYYATIEVQGNNGNVWVDGVQFEEGTLRTYAPRRTFEVGITSSAPANLFLSGTAPTVYIQKFNAGTNDLSTNFYFRIYDLENNLVSSGVKSLTATGGVNGSESWQLQDHGQGFYRILYWLRDDPSGRSGQHGEFVYSVLAERAIPAPNTNLIIGTHGLPYPHHSQGNERVGFNFTRTLSPWSGPTRWTTVEPTDGGYIWLDAEVAEAATKTVIVGNLQDDGSPTWVLNTDLLWLTSTSGIFQANERVRGGAFTGWIQRVWNDGEPVAEQFANSAVLMVVSNPVASGGLVITGQTNAAVGTVSGIANDVLNMSFWLRFVSNTVHHYSNMINYWEQGNEIEHGGVNPSHANDAYMAQFSKRRISRSKT